ncbi:LuxR C-terminal-related transcriptional regulator [Xenophilus azovorans]|uniref:LuxR C-terminal-related transcriptional regulator n=1 Tax=Xenophilus azovorans TaxID=151755 RepID=UPI0009FCB73A|nr:response regulator transcription factor [Xenophilus azovorans]
MDAWAQQDAAAVLCRGIVIDEDPRRAGPAWPAHLTGQAARPVRVVVVDDDAGARRLIAQSLVRDERVSLEGEAASLAEGRRLLARCAFDVALIDLRLGDGCGLELVEAVQRGRSEAECIVVSALEDERRVLRAFELGATGYLLKHCWFQDYARAVLEVANGGAAITPSLARRLLSRLPRAEPRTGALAPPPAPSGTLSSRECEILRLVAAGHVNDEVARELDISAQTVHSHLKSIYRKLRVHTRAQAVGLAGQRGLL